MKIFLSTLCLLVFSQISFSQNNLRVYLNNKQFYDKEAGNYMEFQLQFIGTSIKYLGVDDGLQGELAVYLDIFENDSLIANKAFRLATPFMKDSIIEDFYDLQRFALKPGDYSLKIELKDLNSKQNPLKASQSFTVQEFGESISMSDVIIAEGANKGDGTSQFFRSGYDIIPRLSNFYPNQLTKIPVYFEIYNSELLGDSLFALKQELINTKNGQVIDGFSSTSRLRSNNVVPVFETLNIEPLYTGKYMLEYSIITKAGVRLSTKSYEFERSNDKVIDLLDEEIIIDPAFQASITSDSVGFYLESLIPISGSSEVRNIINLTKEKDEDRARKYIQKYWTVTAPNDPYEGWMLYKKQVQLVETLYSNNFQEGFETDRGRVYLQYGPPTNIISRETSSNEYPYEIWQFNKIGIYSNKRFIFYNPDLVNKTYKLLHSDMIGELKNPKWPHELAKRNTTPGDSDNPNRNVNDHWGQNSADDFRQY